MLDKNLIESTSSWPFVEVRKLLKDRKEIISKNKITFSNWLWTKWATSYWNFW